MTNHELELDFDFYVYFIWILILILTNQSLFVLFARGKGEIKRGLFFV